MPEFDFLKIINEQIATLASVFPKLLGALVVLLIGWVIAKIVAKIIKKTLSSIGADRLAEKLNNIDLIHDSNFRLVPSVLFSKFAYYLLMFVFVMASVEILGIKAVSDLMTNIMNFIPSLLTAFIVLVLGLVIADLFKKAILTAANSLSIPAGKFIANFAFYFLLLNVVLIALKQIDLQTDFFETNLSIIFGGVVMAFAIGYGFASKDLMSSLLSAFYNKDKVSIGDTVSIDGVKGRVIEISNTSLVLLTEANSKVVVPLSKLSSETFEVFE